AGLSERPPSPGNWLSVVSHADYISRDALVEHLHNRFPLCIRQQVGIAHSHFDFLMPHELHNSENRGALQSKPRGEGVPKSMEDDFLLLVGYAVIELQRPDCSPKSRRDLTDFP